MKKKKLECRVRKSFSGMLCVTMLGTGIYIPTPAAAPVMAEDVVVEEQEVPQQMEEAVQEESVEVTPEIEEESTYADVSYPIEVTVAVNGDSSHGAEEHKNYQKWLAPASISLSAGQTAGDAIRKILEDNQYTYTEEDGVITSVTTADGVILEKGGINGANSGWSYSVDGKVSSKKMDEYKLQNGDEILFYFNDDQTLEYHKPVDITLTLEGDTPHEEGKHEAYVTWLDGVAYTVDEGKDSNQALKEAIEAYGYQATYEPGEEYGVYTITTPDGIKISSDDWQYNGVWTWEKAGNRFGYLHNDKVKENDEFRVYYTHEADEAYIVRLIDSIQNVSIRSKSKINWIEYVVDEAGFGDGVNDPKVKKLYDAKKRIDKLEKTAFDISFQLIGDDKHYSEGHTTYKTWLKKRTYQANPGENALQVIEDVLNDVPFHRGNLVNAESWDQERFPFKSDGKRITSITNKDGTKLSNGSNGENSRWVCTVNGKIRKKSLATYELKKNDQLVLYYTDDSELSYPDGASVIKLNYSSLPLQVKQSTSAVKIKSSTIEGDTIKSAKSSKPSVAAVKVAKGKLSITGKKAGTAKITVTSAKKGTATLTVKVQKKKVAVESLSASNNWYNIKRKTSEKIVVKMNPATAQETLKWRSKDKKIATVTQSGVVTGIKKGRTEIIAESPSGVKITIEISVYK